MILTLIKLDETLNSTVSRLYAGSEFICFIIEDGTRKEKIPGETRIPGGTYRLRRKTSGVFYSKYARKYGHKFVWELEDVPNFTGILFHIGNFIQDTAGCLLPNRYITFNGSDWSGMQSAPAYLTFYEWLASGESHVIHILR